MMGTSGASGMWTSKGRYVLMSSSRTSSPSSTSAMIPAHETVLATDASWNTVSLVVRIPRSRSAQPTPVENTTSSPRTTATLIPGVIASASFLRRYCRSSSVPGRVMVLTNENGAIAPTPATRVARAMNSRQDSGEPDGASNAGCEMTGDGSGRTGSRGTARRARARSRVILLDPLPIPSVGSNLGNSRTWTRLTARPPGGTVVTGSPARQTVAPGCEEGPWI